MTTPVINSISDKDTFKYGNLVVDKNALELIVLVLEPKVIGFEGNFYGTPIVSNVPLSGVIRSYNMSEYKPFVGTITLTTNK